MQAPVLNLDVLYYIMVFSSRKTLLKMMLTCHDLHRGGIKHLLRKDPDLRSKKRVDSFVCFCDAGGQVAEVAYRMNHLRGLELELDRDYYGLRPRDKKLGATAQALTRFFATTVRVYAHNFTRLYISRPDDLFDADPNLSEAIASITTLTHLNIRDAAHRSFPFLAALKSRLVEARVALNVDFFDPPEGDITALLRHSELSMTSMSLYHTIDPTGVACYTNVHTLNVGHLKMPITRRYVSTFPNLQVLRASKCMDRFSEDDEEYLQHRNMNIAQRSQGGTWGSLRAYQGSTLLLFLFGLPCHVTYVYLDIAEESEFMDFQQVRAIVADTTPEHLEIFVDEVSHVLEQAADIVALSRSPEFQSLKTFELGLSLCPGDDSMDMEAMLECIHSAVSSSSLTGFALTITWRFDGFCRTESPVPAQVFLESLDVGAIADRFLGSCESLQAVKVAIGKSVKRGPIGVFFDKKTLPEK